MYSHTHSFIPITIIHWMLTKWPKRYLISSNIVLYSVIGSKTCFTQDYTCPIRNPGLKTLSKVEDFNIRTFRRNYGHLVSGRCWKDLCLDGPTSTLQMCARTHWDERMTFSKDTEGFYGPVFHFWGYWNHLCGLKQLRNYLEGIMGWIFSNSQYLILLWSWNVNIF